jgi:hypothetical protein
MVVCSSVGTDSLTQGGILGHRKHRCRAEERTISANQGDCGAGRNRLAEDSCWSKRCPRNSGAGGEEASSAYRERPEAPIGHDEEALGGSQEETSLSVEGREARTSGWRVACRRSRSAPLNPTTGAEPLTARHRPCRTTRFSSHCLFGPTGMRNYALRYARAGAHHPGEGRRLWSPSLAARS